MVEVIHYLKDGTRVDDIVDRVVKISEAEAVYGLMDEINREVKRNDARKSNFNN